MSGSDNLMILPSTDKTRIRLVRIPPDYRDQEVYRHVTGLIARVEEQSPDFDWEEILAVLIENALTYAPDSPVEVRVTRVGPWIDTQVIDHGPGVPHDDSERVFAEYARGRTADGATGTGLGLAVARVLAEVQGGEVALSDTPGGGATFTLRLPADPPVANGEER